jgi:hypothetical protein
MDNNVMENASGANQAPAEAVHQELQTERMLPQSKVNELVGNARREGAEAASVRAVDDYKRQQAQEAQARQPNNSQVNHSDDYIERKALEVLDRQKTEWERQNQEKQQAEFADRVVTTYKQKIAAGKDKYQDFEAVTNTVNMSRYPNVVQLLAEYVDNASDILYSLAQRRGKLAEIETLCERSPEDAVYEMRRLSDSIKANESASQMKNSKAPLSQQRPSNTGTDSGPLSIADYKRMFKG